MKVVTFIREKADPYLLMWLLPSMMVICLGLNSLIGLYVCFFASVITVNVRLKKKRPEDTIENYMVNSLVGTFIFMPLTGIIFLVIKIASLWEL